MKYMLDTNICVYMLNDKHCVRDVFEEKSKDGIAISSIALAELEFGIYHGTAVKMNQVKLLTLLGYIEVLPFDGDAAIIYGQLRANLSRRGQPIGLMDMLIAAHAKTLGLTLVTHNTREFARVDGLLLEDWVNADV